MKKLFNVVVVFFSITAVNLFSMDVEGMDAESLITPEHAEKIREDIRREAMNRQLPQQRLHARQQARVVRHQEQQQRQPEINHAKRRLFDNEQ